MKLAIVALSICIALTAGSCLKQSTYSCNYDACAVSAPAAEIQEVEAYLAANNITGATKHCSGLYYKILEPGTGNNPTNCSVVAVAYKGMLKNGSVFDETATPTALELTRVIKGWQNAIPLVKEGGKITIYIPPALGYGPSAVGPIPANSMLIFDVTLAGVR